MAKKQNYKRRIANVGDFVVCHSLDFNDTCTDFITVGNSYKVLDVFITNNMGNQYFLYKLLNDDDQSIRYNSKLFKSMIDWRESKLESLLQ